MRGGLTKMMNVYGGDEETHRVVDKHQIWSHDVGSNDLLRGDIDPGLWWVWAQRWLEEREPLSWPWWWSRTCFSYVDLLISLRRDGMSNWFYWLCKLHVVFKWHCRVSLLDSFLSNSFPSCLMMFSISLIMKISIYTYWSLTVDSASGMILQLVFMEWTSLLFWSVLAIVWDVAEGASPVLESSTVSQRRMLWSGSRWNMREWSLTSLRRLFS